MKELIPKDEYGVFADKNDTPRVDSLYVADRFEKRHSHVIRDIDRLTQPNSGLSEMFIKNHFTQGTYKDSTGRKLKCYFLTRDGFTMLVMGFTGKKALKFKELYITRFNEMEEMIKTLKLTREQFPLLTENIRLLHENPKPYHFSNECDMLNRIVLGMSAKQFKLKNGIDVKEKSIRAYLSQKEIDMLETLQRVDIGLLVAFPNYEDRKKHLEWYKATVLDN